MFGKKKRTTTVLYIAVEIEHDEDFVPGGLVRYLSERVVEHTSVYSSRLECDRVTTGNSLLQIINHISEFGWIKI